MVTRERKNVYYGNQLSHREFVFLSRSCIPIGKTYANMHISLELVLEHALGRISVFWKCQRSFLNYWRVSTLS